MNHLFVLRSRRVFLPTHPSAADVVVRHGKIVAVDPYGSHVAEAVGDVIHDVGDLNVLPGLVDTHVHLNEPGREEWEGIRTGTRAALAGGVTTVVDMPLNSSPVTTTAAALDLKRRASEGKRYVDIGFHAGLIPSNADKIDDVLRAGAMAAKAFLCPSGIDEFPHCEESDLRIAMPILAEMDAVLMVHAEIVSGVPPMKNPRSYADYLASRPVKFERDAIEMMIRLAREFDCRVHLVHLSDAGSIPMIEAARNDGIRLTVETCPQYLVFDAESIPDGRTDFKCAPPIRNAANREKLWDGLVNGHIDMIVSDHSPCPPEMKCLDTGRFDQAWGGISSLQLGLPAIWTEAHRRAIELSQVVRWMSSGPADLVGIPSGIAIGNPAHLVVFDPQANRTVDQTQLFHRHPVTPYHGKELRGSVIQTFVHGSDHSQATGKTL